MIEIRNLSKNFGQTEVLKNINLTINTGGVYALAGKSGSGKSTLLRCINGLEKYDSGNLLVDGVEVSTLKEKEAREFKKNMGMIFQQFSLLSKLDVYENVALPMKCWKYDKNIIDKKVKELLQIVKMEGKIHSKPNELSGGQKQRVAIARALSLNPKFLLCDEATSALDPKIAVAIMSLLCKINKELNITIVVVSHQMSVLQNSCEEMAILENGIIADKGRIEKIFLKQPPCLENILGKTNITMPSTGVNLKIILPAQLSEKPIITSMARELNTDFTFIGGEMEQYRVGVMGSVIINVPSEKVSAICNYLKKQNAPFSFIDDNEALQNEEENA